MAAIGIEVLFIAGFGPIDRDAAESRALYGDSLGILFKEDAGGISIQVPFKARSTLPYGLFRRRRNPASAAIPGPYPDS